MAAGGFLASRGMAAQPAGEESCRTPLRQGERGAAVLGPDQATRGRVGRAPDRPGRCIGDRLPPTKRETLGRLTALSQRKPQHSRHPATSPPSVHLIAARRGGLEEDLSSRAAHARPSVLAASVPNPASSSARVSASPFGQPQATLTYVRVPLHPGRSVRVPSRVRDRARQGRNGAVGSSGAEEPGPKGDAKLSWPFMEGPMRNKLW